MATRKLEGGRELASAKALCRLLAAHWCRFHGEKEGEQRAPVDHWKDLGFSLDRIESHPRVLTFLKKEGEEEEGWQGRERKRRRERAGDPVSLDG